VQGLKIFLSQQIMNKLIIKKLKFFLVCHVACNDWSMWHTVSFPFFNKNLTEGLKPKNLETAGTNAKQKKCRD